MSANSQTNPVRTESQEDALRSAIQVIRKQHGPNWNGAEVLETYIILNNLHAHGNLTQKGNREYQALQDWLIDTIDAGIEATPTDTPPEAVWTCPECGSKRLHRTGHCIVSIDEVADADGNVADYETGDWDGYIGTLNCECRDCAHSWTLEL